MFLLPITQQDKMNLLVDILTNQQEDCCGSFSELEQLQRLVKTLMSDGNLTTDEKQILNEIYRYTQAGMNTNNLDDHIESHQQRLSQWVDSMNHLS